MARHSRLRVAFGPAVTGWGSWDWVGLDIARALQTHFEVTLFDALRIPPCDVLCVIKHVPPATMWQALPTDLRVIFAPVDAYGAVAEIDRDAPWLRRCQRIVVHCERLRRFFAPYAPVEFLDHHVKYVGHPSHNAPPDGPLLWIGVRSNLTPLVQWVNTNQLPRPLVILTNPDDPSHPFSPEEAGFCGRNRVNILTWSAQLHHSVLTRCAAALDVKGTDFRARHKPPAKAIDFLAAGMPLAMNPDSSSVEHLANMGFDLCDCHQVDRWLSAEYRNETRHLGAALRELLSLPRIAFRWRKLIEDVAT